MFDRAKFVEYGLVAWSTTSPHAAAYSVFNTKLFEGEVNDLRHVTDVDCHASGQVVTVGSGQQGATIAFAAGRRTLSAPLLGEQHHHQSEASVLALGAGRALVAQKANRLLLFSVDNHVVHHRAALNMGNSPKIVRRGSTSERNQLVVVGLSNGTISVYSLGHSTIHLAGSFQLDGHRPTPHLHSLDVAGFNHCWLHVNDSLICLRVSLSSSATSHHVDDDVNGAVEAEVSLVSFVDRETNETIEAIPLLLAGAEGTLLLPNSRTRGIEVATPRADSIVFTSINVENDGDREGANPFVGVHHSTSPFPRTSVVGMWAMGATHMYRVLLLNERGSRCLESVTVDFRASAVLERSSVTLQQRIAWCSPEELPALRSACEHELDSLIRDLPPRSAKDTHDALCTISRLQSTAFAFFQRETELVQDSISAEDSISVLLNRKLRSTFLLVLTCRLLQRLGVYDRCAAQPLSQLFDLRNRKRDLVEKSLELRDFFHSTFHVDTRFCDTVEEMSRWGNTTSIVEALVRQCLGGSADPDRTTLIQLVDSTVRGSVEMPEALVVLIAYAGWMAEEKSVVDAALADWLQTIQSHPSLAGWAAAAFSADIGDTSISGEAIQGLDRESSVADALLQPLLDAFCANSCFEQAFQLVPLALSRDTISDRVAVKLLLLAFVRRSTSLLVQLYRRSLATSWHFVATRVLVHAAVSLSAASSSGSEEEANSYVSSSHRVELLEGLIQPNSLEETILRDVLNAVSGDAADRLRIEALVMLHHYAEALELCRVFPIKGSADGQFISDFQARLVCLVDLRSQNSDRVPSPAAATTSGTLSALNPKVIGSSQLASSESRSTEPAGHESRSHFTQHPRRAQASVLTILPAGGLQTGAPLSSRGLQSVGPTPAPTPRLSFGAGRQSQANTSVAAPSEDQLFCDAVLPRSRKSCGNKLPCEYHTSQ